MMNKWTITPFWDKRALKDGKARIMLTVNLNRKQFRVSLKLFSSKTDYDKALSGKTMSETQRELRKSINDYVSKAETVLLRLKEPSKESFLKFFKAESDFISSDKTDAYAYIDSVIADMNAAERFTSAINLGNSLSSLKKYKPKLYFEDLNDTWLKGYKSFMVNSGRSVTTAGIHLRALRGVFKQAVKDGIVVMKNNPFEGVSVSWTVASKNVLYPEQLKQLWEFQPTTLRETRAKDFFFFCYLANGMNFWDVANLKWKNIKGDYMTFIRSKTSGTTQNPKEVKVYLHDELKRIINVYASKSRKPDDFIFQIFNKHKNDPKKHHDTFRTYKGRTNGTLKRIAKQLEIDARVYLGVARHSFATKHKLAGTPTSFISEFLGHSNEKTTANYLKSIPDTNLKQISANLLSFNG